MKRLLLVISVVGLVFTVVGVASAAPQWYDIKFTGADVWTYSADNLLESRTNQDAPRRYRDWTQANPVRSTTYGVNNQGSAAVDFNTSAAVSSFAFDSINLWGAGATGDWNETYVSVGNSDPGAEGVSSWKVIQSPVGWSWGIVEGNDPWSADATHAFPVWRSAGASDRLGLANMNDPDFVFRFQVLADPALLDSNGKLRVFFGGYSDDQQMTGPQNYEVSGVMTLTATPVPEPTTLVIWSVLGALGLALGWWRRCRAA